ncbi:MAG: HAD hydrolase-like protein [Mariprofundus sp.]|nr:HAD hydrolase-like protein [Mariprofundus sp.]
MKNLKQNIKFKNIFFDFDGVIAESVSAKTEAFRELYAQYGKTVTDKVVEHHINHGGVSRYEKFKIYHKIFLKKNISESKVQQLAQKFSRLVLDKVIDSEEVTGCKDFLNRYSKDLNFWIITGTPKIEIELIAEARGIGNHFLGLHGSPENKKYWTEYLIKKNALKRDETLFLGDATTDFEAAQFSKIHFGLREHSENKHIFSNYNGLKFNNFVELERNIKKYL